MHGPGGDHGLFFARRKGERLRIILDAWVINRDVLLAPSTRPPAPSASGALEADQQALIASSGLEAAFYHMP
eukprot:1863905-Pyramimonas_sp.AAC.1